MLCKATLPALSFAFWLTFGLLGACPAGAAGPPSQFGVDAPELARLGELAVGVRTLTLVQRNQEEVLALDQATGSFPKSNRALTVALWYPAAPASGAQREIYTASLPSIPPAGPANFTVPGIAVRDAQ